jgi:hypothetical protein
MSSYANANRVWERRSFVSASKAAGDAVKAEDSRQGVAGNLKEEATLPPCMLTLDDFGGRSDALGG